MEKEQKSRRPRIAASGNVSRDGNFERFEKVNYSNREKTPYADRPQRPAFDGEHRESRNYENRNNYGERQNNYGDQRSGGYGERPAYGERSGSYGNRSYNNNYGNRSGYNNRDRNSGGYENRSYNNSQERNFNRIDTRTQGNTERNYNSFDTPARNYTPREGNENRGYGENRRPAYGGNRGGYNNNRSNGGGYRSNEGGYRPNGGGYRSQSEGFRTGTGSNRTYNKPMRPRTDDYDPNAKYSQKKRIEYAQENIDPNEPIRLNKFMANAGICSRREADEYIVGGRVQVNGEVKTELGTKIHRNDEVTFDGKVVTLEHKVYVLLNKPKNCVTTAEDPQGRLTVMDIVRNACKERIYPVGRLDRQTTGVILLTNDGELASKLTHPKFIKKKIYHVWLDKDVTEEDMQKIADGIELEDGPIQPDAISYATETDKNQIGIEIHSGKNRIVRRIFESLGYRVIKLDRVYFAGLTKKNLPRGRWRHLTQLEVNMLRIGSYE